jgi:hypothetical protein
MFCKKGIFRFFVINFTHMTDPYLTVVSNTILTTLQTPLRMLADFHRTGKVKVKVPRDRPR